MAQEHHLTHLDEFVSRISVTFVLSITVDKIHDASSHRVPHCRGETSRSCNDMAQRIRSRMVKRAVAMLKTSRS